MKRILALAALAAALAGCQDKPVAQAPVQNFFTDYVDRGVTTMKKAQSVADQMNEQTAKMNARTNSSGDSQ